jgi:hypothetical protein
MLSCLDPLLLKAGAFTEYGLMNSSFKRVGKFLLIGSPLNGMDIQYL